MDKKAKKITCKIDKEDSNRIILTVYNKNEEIIGTFKHDRVWNDEDDLCCKMQQKVEIKSTDFYGIWHLIDELYTSLREGMSINFEIVEN